MVGIEPDEVWVREPSPVVGRLTLTAETWQDWQDLIVSVAATPADPRPKIDVTLHGVVIGDVEAHYRKSGQVTVDVEIVRVDEVGDVSLSR